MKLTIITPVFILLMTVSAISQRSVPNLPITVSGASAEVWNNSIYLFGGSPDYYGTSGNLPRVYKYDGSDWTYYDSIPDNSLWGLTTVLVDNVVYLIGGFPFESASRIRSYNLTTGDWNYLADNNIVDSRGITAEYYDGKLFVFNSTNLHSFNVSAYDIATDSWTQPSGIPKPPAPGMNSVIYNDEIYITGFAGAFFYKYNPASNQWTELATPTRLLRKCGMGLINNLIYCAGGGMNDLSVPNYDDVMVYDISTDTWSTDSYVLSQNKHWMASAQYNGGFFVLGGKLATSSATNEVEEIVPEGTVPVELTSFTYNVVNGKVVLHWTTATETNNQLFEIEREINGSFITIGFVNGNGTTTQPSSYSFTDESALAGITYYRLKQIDFNGRYKYTDAIEVNVPLEDFSLGQNYPNPFNPSTKINFSIPQKSFVTLKVYNIQGEEVASLISGELNAGVYNAEWNGINLPSGVYIYSLNTGNVVLSKKMQLLK